MKNQDFLSANTNDKTLLVTTLPHSRLHRREAGELLMHSKSKHVLVQTDTAQSILNELQNAYNTHSTGEVHYYSFFDMSLNTLCVMVTKKTEASNIMFEIDTRWNTCVGIYGDAELEPTLPEPKHQNKLSYTCFKGFNVFDDYVGLCTEVFRYNKLILEGGIEAETEASIILFLDKGKLKDLEGFDKYLKVHKVEDSLICQWECHIGDMAEMVSDICTKLNISVFSLYETKLKTSSVINKMLLKQGVIRQRTFDKADYGLDRLYKVIQSKTDTIVVY